MKTLYPVQVRQTSRFLCLVLVACLFSCYEKSSVPENTSNAMFRGNPQHLGTSDAKPFRNGKVKWRFETKGAIRGSASISNETLFIGSADGNLYALNKSTGEEKWKFKTEGAVYSTPAVYKDMVIFTSRDHYVYALTINNGELVWKFKSGELPAHKWGWDYFISSPTVVDDNVYYGTEDGFIFSLDAPSGKENWKYKTNGRIRATPAERGGILYVGSFDSNLYALEAETGELKWKFETDGVHFDSDSAGWDRNSIDSSPALTDTAVVFGSRDGNVYALNTLTGKQYWKFSYGPTWSLSSPAIHKGTVYIGWSDNNLFSAIDLATGTEKWKFQCRHYVYSSPLVTDTIVYVGSHDKNFYALNATTGKKIWQYRTNGSILSSPVMDGGLLYIGSDDGNLYAFEKSDAPIPKMAVFAMQSPPKYYPVDPRLGPYLVQYGFEPLDSVSLESFLQARLSDKQKSVLVFVTDRIPSTVLTAGAAGEKTLIRKYLDAGGKVVWLGVTPNLYKFDLQGNITGEDSSPAESILGISYDATHDWGSYSSNATEEGKKWGLPTGWTGSFSIKAQDGITVLAINDLNRPSAWIKNFGGGPGTGFVHFRPWDVGRWARDNELEMVRKVAEYGL